MWRVGGRRMGLVARGVRSRIGGGRLARRRRLRLFPSRQDDGYTVLHKAARRGHVEVMELLKANGADVNATDVRAARPAPRLAPLSLASPAAAPRRRTTTALH